MAPLLALVRDRRRRVDDWYQQRWFRYGQKALRAGRPVPGLRRLFARSVPDDDIAPGIMIVQKEAERDRVHLWVGAVLYDQLTDTVEAVVELAPRGDDGRRADGRGGGAKERRRVPLHRFGMESEKAVTGWAPGTRFFHTHVTFDGVAPDAWYVASVTVPEPARPQPGPLQAHCRARTLPDAIAVGAPPLRVFTASCYDVDTDKADQLDKAYRALFPDGTGPDLTWILGDATYADAPFWLYGTMARYTPRTFALLEYWAAWGMQYGPDADPAGGRRPGMRALLTNGPNWFLPDDHEFWNNWPHATVTSHHSYGNLAKALAGVTRRAVGNLRPLAADATVAAPEEPGLVPDDPLVQNYLPVHPDEWDRWIRAAFDLMSSFETRSVRDREAGRITWGDRDDDPADDPQRPPRGGPPGVVHRPLNQVLQTVDLGDVAVALLDTRTRRTRTLHHPSLGAFVDEEFLNGLLDVARRAPIFVLVMPEPALQRPAWRPGKRLREPVVVADIGIRHYSHQYERFWTGLVAARAGRPTITVAGDIHRSYVAHAPSIALVEVVASPMSPVFGQALLTLGADGIRRVKNGLLRSLAVPDPYARDAVLAEVDDLLTGPKDLAATDLPDGLPGGQATSLACLPRPKDDEGGFAVLALERPEAHRYRLITTLHDRNRLAAGDHTAARTVAFDLRTDVAGPGSVTDVSPPDVA